MLRSLDREEIALLQTAGPLTASIPTPKADITIPENRQKSALWFSGWAMGFTSPFRAGRRYHKIVCSPQTFDRWSKSVASRQVPVLVGHDPNWNVPSIGPTLFSPRVRGMKVAFAVDISTLRGKAVAEAIRRNWLTNLSLQLRWSEKNSEMVFDRHEGRCHVAIQQARAVEISLTNRPAAPGTSIAIVDNGDDWGDEPRRSIPDDPAVRSTMLRLLSTFGIQDDGTATEEVMTSLQTVANSQQYAMSQRKPRW